MFNLYDEEAKNNSEYQMTSEMLQVLEIYEKNKKKNQWTGKGQCGVVDRCSGIVVALWFVCFSLFFFEVAVNLYLQKLISVQNGCRKHDDARDRVFTLI